MSSIWWSGLFLSFNVSNFWNSSLFTRLVKIIQVIFIFAFLRKNQLHAMIWQLMVYWDKKGWSFYSKTNKCHISFLFSCINDNHFCTFRDVKLHCKVIIGRNPIEANANTIAIQLPGNPVAYIVKCFTPY